MEIGGFPNPGDGHYEHGSRNMPVVASGLEPCGSSQLASRQSELQSVGRKVILGVNYMAFGMGSLLMSGNSTSH